MRYVWVYSIKRTRSWTRTFRKSEPRTIWKSRPYTKIHCMSYKTRFWQLWGRWCQIWQKFLKTLALKYPYQAFLVLYLGIFVFSQKFAVRQFRGCRFEIQQLLFKIIALKYQNDAFLVSNLTIFIFASTFATKQIQGHQFQIWQ